MTQHSGLILSEDSGFRAQVARMFRSGSVPIKVTEERLRDAAARSSETFDVVVVDIRGELAPAMAAVERLRARLPGASILAIADTASSDHILQEMRAVANEFLDWPPSDVAFQTAVRRFAVKR
jgi:DNA-binding NtrC family response regulator